jgi:hypothetical protein
MTHSPRRTADRQNTRIGLLDLDPSQLVIRSKSKSRPML